MKKILLVGGTGFVGSHFTATFGSQYDIFPVGRDVDICNPNSISALVHAVQPDTVVHLAAITTLKESFADPSLTYATNFLGTLNLLSALRENHFQGRMLNVSSSEVYGLLKVSNLPVSESLLAHPLSPYAVAKIASEALCYQWSQVEKFEIISARPFNHIGPGQSNRFAIADFGKQIAAIKLGLAEPILHVGDIDTTRDFTDVRDIVCAYHALLNSGKNGETYNVCTGVESSVRSLILRMCELVSIEVELRTDPARIRLSDQRRVCGSFQKLTADTSWKPHIALDKTLLDIVEYWINCFNQNKDACK
jgi:GDP-4-dehydro-6-deoxy-D-mannose reductase